MRYYLLLLDLFHKKSVFVVVVTFVGEAGARNSKYPDVCRQTRFEQKTLHWWPTFLTYFHITSLHWFYSPLSRLSQVTVFSNCASFQGEKKTNAQTNKDCAISDVVWRCLNQDFISVEDLNTSSNFWNFCCCMYY